MNINSSGNNPAIRLSDLNETNNTIAVNTTVLYEKPKILNESQLNEILREENLRLLHKIEELEDEIRCLKEQ